MKKQRIGTGSYSFMALLFLFASLVCTLARAQLMINPTRVVFDKNQRAAQIDVVNSGTTVNTYRVNIVNRRMTESGEFLPITEPGAGDQFAGPMLVYSPRQIVLQPGAQQLVRIAVRKPADLAPGEYRSHISFEQVADPSLANTIESQAVPGKNEVAVTLTPLIGLSIPVIIRQGQTDASVSISNIVLEKPKSAAEPALVGFELNRVGNRSIYGDIAVTFKTAAGTEQVVARAGGVAVYVPNSIRRVRLTLQTPGGVLPKGGSLAVTFKERVEDGGKLLAENLVQIP